MIHHEITEELPQGAIVTLMNGTRLKVVANLGCDKCYFSPHYPCCPAKCDGSRKDKAYINYVKID